MGAIYPQNQGSQTFSMTSYNPAQTTPPASYNTGTSPSNPNVYMPQGNYVPYAVNQNPNTTIKQDAGVFDSKPQVAPEPSYMDKVKKYAPFIIGGAVLLYYVMRKK